MRNYQKKYRRERIVPYEDQECHTLVQYLEAKNLKYSHIHHEMFTTSIGQKVKAKRLGVKPGVPDYIVILKNRLLFIEMKRKKGGTLSQAQKEWIDELNKIPNIEAHVCYGYDEAEKLIEGILSNDIQPAGN